MHQWRITIEELERVLYAVHLPLARLRDVIESLIEHLTPRYPVEGYLGAQLRDFLGSEFVSFFHLQELEKPEREHDGIRRYKPSGARFRPLVSVDLDVNQGRVNSAALEMDSRFVDSSGTAPFARDIAGSFLRAFIPKANSRLVVPLLAAIRNGDTDLIALYHFFPECVDQPIFANLPLYRIFSGLEGVADGTLSEFCMTISRKAMQVRLGIRATPN